MQPAFAEVVQYFATPGSTATAGARLSASRSLPAWTPPGRGCPKSSVNVTAPTTGNTSVGTPPFVACAVATAAQAIGTTAISRSVRRIRGTVATCSPDANLGAADRVTRA